MGPPWAKLLNDALCSRLPLCSGVLLPPSLLTACCTPAGAAGLRGQTAFCRSLQSPAWHTEEAGGHRVKCSISEKRVMVRHQRNDVLLALPAFSQPPCCGPLMAPYLW